MKKEDIILNNKELLERDLSLDMLRMTNDILEAKLDDSTKNRILSLTLNCNHEHIYLSDLVYHFFLNENINKNNKFKEIVKLMQDKKALNMSSIKTYAMIGKKVAFIGQDRALNLVKDLVNLDNDNYSNFRLITEFLKTGKIDFGNSLRLDIITDVLIKTEASHDILNGEDTTPFMIDVLNNDAFDVIFEHKKFGYDIDYVRKRVVDFRKIVEFSINNLGWHFIYSLLKNKVDIDKIELAVDYYTSLYRYITKWIYVTMEHLDSEFEDKPLYKLPLKMSYLPFDDYKKKLDMVKNSTNPISYSIVELSDLEENHKNFVLDLINDCPNEYRKDCIIDKKYDYLDNLIVVATSDLAKSLDIDSYKELLIYMQICILENKRLEKEENNNDKYGVEYLNDRTNIIPYLLRYLFKNEPFLAYNMPRLKHLIELIKTSDINNKQVIEKIIEVANNPNSLYYTDKEFIRLEGILNDIYKSAYINDVQEDKSKFFNIKSLLINNNVPFMDKQEIFDIAINKSNKEILEITKSLNNEGLINRNMAILLGTLTGPLEQEYVLKRKQ